MTSITRGHVIVPESRSTVFEDVLEVCDKLKAKIEDVNKSSYQIKGKSPKFLIILSNKHQTNTFIDVYDLKPTTKPQADFIIPFFESLVTKIPFDSAYETYVVDNIRTTTSDCRSGYIDPILLKPHLFDVAILDSADNIQDSIYDANKLAIIPKTYNNEVEFRKDNQIILSISARSIKKVKVTSHIRGRFKKRHDLIIQLIYQDPNSTINKEISLDVEDDFANLIQKQILLLRDTENDRGLQKLLMINLRPDLCRLCLRDKSYFYYDSEKLCRNCFENRWGRVIIDKQGAEYYGGHKAHLAGGLFTKAEYGSLYLTQKHVLFVHPDKDPSKTWKITIPLSSIITERWLIEEESRRKQVAAGGSSWENIGFGTAVMHETGKAHHIVIPYMDENGIPQEPRFGISSFQGMAIREWASQFYDQVVHVKKEKSQPNQKISATLSSQTPIGVPIIAKSNQNKSADSSSNPSGTSIADHTTSKNNNDQQMLKPSTYSSTTHSPSGNRTINKSVPSHENVKEPEQSNEGNKGNDIGEFVKILKMRLVKGEISKEEFVELRRLVED
ncbi:MAG TPA: hypothetical protein VE130_02830 [Nitrososphaeraceae archaeon]|nr:hypothetical protein [Nitrososphaeraceae archaeon]